MASKILVAQVMLLSSLTHSYEKSPFHGRFSGPWFVVWVEPKFSRLEPPGRPT
jgi:hypothetical protein